MTFSQSELRRTGQAARSGGTRPHWTRRERRDLVDQLATYDFFERCARTDLAALVDASTYFAVPAGWPLMHEETPADSCYAVLSGTAEVYFGRQRIAQLGVGSIVGEMAVLTGTLRRATVTSTTSLRGLRVDNDSLEALFARRPALLAALRGAYESRVATAARRPLRISFATS